MEKNERSFKLMYKNIPVMEFNTKEERATILRSDLLPFGIANKKDGWNMIRSFCSARMLMTSREYCKEILNACGIDDQTDVNICIVSRALSFRDNFWVKDQTQNETWENVNLYENKFSRDIAIASLTGEIDKTVHIGDRLYTGELTNKGIRAKCFIKDNNGGIWLAKAERPDEIFAEIISGKIASFLHLPHTDYYAKKVFGTDCSVCKIQTSSHTELIPARDVLEHFSSEMCSDSMYYEFFTKHGGKDFLRMQLFDILTMNTDRNRDNFALKKENGKISGLYPIFDHDSCFKGKSLNGIYFPTRKTFADTLEFLCVKYPAKMSEFSICIHKLQKELTNGEFGVFLEEYMDRKKIDLFLENTSIINERLAKVKKQNLNIER